MFRTRPEFELYNVSNDPCCLENLAKGNVFQTLEDKLGQALMNKLKRLEESHVLGSDTKIFDSCTRYINVSK